MCIPLSYTILHGEVWQSPLLTSRQSSQLRCCLFGGSFLKKQIHDSRTSGVWAIQLSQSERTRRITTFIHWNRKMCFIFCSKVSSNSNDVFIFRYTKPCPKEGDSILLLMTSICWPIWISHNVLCASPHFTLPCEILIPCQKTSTNFTKYKTRLRDGSYIVSLKCRWLSRQLDVWIADNQDHKIRQSTGFGSKIKTVGGHVPIGLVVGSVWYIKLTYVSFWAHVKIASCIVCSCLVPVVCPSVCLSSLFPLLMRQSSSKY